MDPMVHVWNVVEHARVASGAAELAIFTVLLYWFFTSSRVADMLEVVGERVGGWCGRDTSSLRQAVRTHRRQVADVYSKLDADIALRNASLYRLKDGPVVPPPQPKTRPPVGLACSRCAPGSRESWQDPAAESGTVINILDIGRQKFANGGVVSRYLCDLAQCLNLVKYDYKDVTPAVLQDEQFQNAIEEEVREEMNASGVSDTEQQYAAIRRRIEAKALKILASISSAMSNNVLKLVAWLCHKAVRRVAGGGCGTRASARLSRARAAGLPLVFVPLHRSHFDYILVTFTLYLTGLRPPLVAAGDNMRIPLFGWFLRGCGAFFIRRRTEGSNYHSDQIYKSALRAYILNSLSANNNLEFFIEGGRTRTGKPQLPKAGILSVIMDAYLDGTIDDALLVPVTLNYDKLVDGNFVREQLGMPKQMETFWSALRGIWRTLNTNHGGIRVDFNQPISLKELVTSFHNYSHLKSPIESTIITPNNNLAVNLDKQILYNHSHSSMYGAEVSTDHKMMVEAIGRHLVYDAAQSTALMCTNVVAYVLCTELRRGGPLSQLQRAAEIRATRLIQAGRDLGYSGDTSVCVARALDTLGKSLVRREGRGPNARVRPQAGVGAALELAYYANTVVAHYAPAAIMATALESVVCGRSPGAEPEVRHVELMAAALQLSEILSQEFILCPPCQRIEDCLEEALQGLVADEVLAEVKKADGLDEQRWSRRLAHSLDDEEEERDPLRTVKYRLSDTQHATAERRRLILTLRPLLEAYSMACRRIHNASQKEAVTLTLDALLEDFSQNKMVYGEAVSTDAIRNCHKLLRLWGVLQISNEGRQRNIRLCPPYDDPRHLDDICANVYKFNMSTPLLRD